MDEGGSKIKKIDRWDIYPARLMVMGYREQPGVAT